MTPLPRSPFRPALRTSRRALLASACTLALAGCMGIDVASVRRADAGATPAPDAAIAIGRVRFVVDGEPLAYGLLNKPAMQLYRRDDGRYFASPEVRSDGTFAWSLPPGDWAVAVLFGGMPPAGVPHRMATGQTAFVNGIVDPGVAFRLAPGRTHYLGTLEVSVRSKPASAIVGNARVFGELLGVRVVDERATDRAALPDPAAAPGAAGFTKLERAR